MEIRSSFKLRLGTLVTDPGLLRLPKVFCDCLFDGRGTAGRALQPLGMARHAPTNNYFWQSL
jgi:hypothetical protein